MTRRPPKQTIEKVPTGIAGLDLISAGGLPKGRTTLLSGSAGSGKTVLGGQFLAGGIVEYGEPGLFVTFEESADTLIRNMRSFGWPVQDWVDDERLVFLDASIRTSANAEVIGPYDFAALMARIEATVRRIGAKRVVLDSIGSVLSMFTEAHRVRRELQRLAQAVSDMGCTALVSSERDLEYGPVSRFGVEQFVADDVIILRNVLEQEQVRRTIQILKFRGTYHRKGEFPFTIDAARGVVVLPIGGRTPGEPSSEERVPSGNPQLDEMCGGGFLRGSLVLVTGATGTGRTLASTTFLQGGAQNGERCVLFAFEESRQQLVRNARGSGIDFESMEESGLLHLYTEYPEVHSLEDHLLAMRTVLDEVQPDRIALDSLSALEHNAGPRGFRQFMMGLTAMLRERSITGLFTATTPTLIGGESITMSNVAAMTDSIILLRYVEVLGEIKRGITVLKMRGSHHENLIREIDIDETGMHIGAPFREVEGILGGMPKRVSSGEDRIRGLFSEDLPG